MSWLQLEVSATPAMLTGLEEALLAAGAAALTLLSDADEPVLEPAPDETPLWSQVRLRALFELSADMTLVRENLQAVDGFEFTSLVVEFVGEHDWQAAAGNHAVDRVFSDRLRLQPKPAERAAVPRRGAGEPVNLFLEPGLAFGSGSHPTTSLCLEWLAQHVRSGQRVMDFGCGSGVLGIAAGLLGASVVAVDHDAQAVMATQDNSTYNGLPPSEFCAMHTDQWRAADYIGRFDVVVANILAGPLQNLAATFEEVAAPGGSIVLAGVLTPQADEVMAAYADTVFDPIIERDGWALLCGVVGD